MHTKKRTKDHQMQMVARPRDSAVTDRPENQRTLESYRIDREWVVEAIDDTGRWLFTYFETHPMTRAQAVKLAKNWFRSSMPVPVSG